MNVPPVVRSSPLHVPLFPFLAATNNGGATAVNPAIECRNLSYSISTRHGKFVPILNDCSLSIPAGQFWMLLGPNGCGKSTLLKILAGLLNPNGGFLRIEKPRSFVFQNPDHQVVMPTVEADVAFGLGKFNMSRDEITSRVAKALNAVGMYEYLQRPVQTLSGGQKQRVAIAGALAEACKVLLLDELTTFLDESDQLGVIEAVKSCLVASQDTTALWVTHRLEELEYADGAVYMEDGRIVLHGDALTVLDFVKAKQASYINQINSLVNFVGIVVYHGGKWMATDDYKGYLAVGLMVLLKHNGLVELIKSVMKPNKSHIELLMKYRPEDQGLFFNVTRDAMFTFTWKQKPMRERTLIERFETTW